MAGFSVGYNKGFSQFSGLTQFETDDALTSDFDITIAKFWTFKCSYENLKIQNSNKQSNFMILPMLRCYQKNSPFF
jgi:hypothetical protein